LTRPLLVTILGPTAVGKTDLAIEAAKLLRCNILSADSRQFYREMNVGTAKPSPQQLEEVPHSFVNNLSVHDVYSVGDFERDVLQYLNTYFAECPVLLMVGGSGLYIDAVLKGLDEMPQVPEELRHTIMQEVESGGLENLLHELKEKDADYYHKVDLNNTQRVVRAIEVIRHTGQPFSSFWKKEKTERFFDVLKIGMVDERAVLYKRINDRVDVMLQNGLLEEARFLYPLQHLYALQTVGYQEFFDFFEGKGTQEQAVELVKRNTRRYAKRQLTWFRKDLETRWFGNHQRAELLEYVKSECEKRGVLSKGFGY
jgi:tRNA dimethylallyltransferase